MPTSFPISNCFGKGWPDFNTCRPPGPNGFLEGSGLIMLHTCLQHLLQNTFYAVYIHFTISSFHHFIQQYTHLQNTRVYQHHQSVSIPLHQSAIEQTYATSDTGCRRASKMQKDGRQQWLAAPQMFTLRGAERSGPVLNMNKSTICLLWKDGDTSKIYQYTT